MSSVSQWAVSIFSPPFRRVDWAARKPFPQASSLLKGALALELESLGSSAHPLLTSLDSPPLLQIEGRLNTMV